MLNTLPWDFFHKKKDIRGDGFTLYDTTLARKGGRRRVIDENKEESFRVESRYLMNQFL